MEDYEIRDTMRRATTPDLFVELSFASGTVAQIEFGPHQQLSKPIALLASIGNRSPQPAFHTIIQLGIDANLSLRTPGEFEQIGQRDENGDSQNWLRRRLSSPPDLPIFRESELSLNRSFLTFGYPERLLYGDDHLFHLTTSVQTPGYDATERWLIRQQGATLTLVRVPATR